MNQYYNLFTSMVIISWSVKVNQIEAVNLFMNSSISSIVLIKPEMNT